MGSWLARHTSFSYDLNSLFFSCVCCCMLLLTACESPAVSPFLVLQTAPDVLAFPGKILIWKPPLDDYTGYDDWFQTILKARKPALIVIDEPGSLGKGKAES